MLLMLMLLMLTLMMMMMLMSMLVLTMLEMGFSVRSFSLPATTHCLGLSLTHNGGKELWLGDGIRDNRFVPTPSLFSVPRVASSKKNLFGRMQNFWLVNSRLAHSAFSIAGRLHFFLLLCWPSILPAASSLFIHLASMLLCLVLLLCLS